MIGTTRQPDGTCSLDTVYNLPVNTKCKFGYYPRGVDARYQRAHPLVDAY
jgi:hypothetical protein